MKKVLFAVLCLSLAWSGCKKNEPTPAESTENGKASEDNQGVQNHADAAITDANNLVSANGSLSGRLSEAAQNAVDTNICGAAKDYSQIGQGILTVSYDGVTVCNNRKRGGTIRITLLNYTTGARWIQANAKLKVDFINYKVTRASDGKSIKLNGNLIITNQSGGNFITLFLGSTPSLVHTVEGSSMQVAFDDSLNGTWNINRRYSYAWNSNVATCTGEGIGTNNGVSNLENWGTTRNGFPFTSQVTTPVVWNTTCGAWAPVQGKVVIRVQNPGNAQITTTFGVNTTGQPVPITPNTCPYGMKIEWVWGGSSGNRILGYL
jgi:hypothetical protein